MDLLKIAGLSVQNRGGGEVNGETGWNKKCQDYSGH